MRHFEGEGDYARLAEVFTSYMSANGVEAAFTAEEIAQRYSNVKNFDLHRDLVLVEANGSVIAYSLAAWVDEETEGQTPVRIYWFRRYLVPEWWDSGLERTLVR